MPPGGLISRLALSLTAFEAIVETLPLGSVGYEPALNAKGERLIWVEAAVADRLMAMRRAIPTSSCGWSRTRRRAGAVSHSLTVLGFSPEIAAWPGSSPRDDTAKADRAIRGARRRDPRQAVVAGGSGGWDEPCSQVRWVDHD